MDAIATIAVTFGLAAAMAFGLGLALAYFREKFKVEGHPVADAALAILPGANCGACGYPGCAAYAAAVAGGSTRLDLCTTGGKTCAQALGKLMGVEATAEDRVAVLLCQGTLAGEHVRALPRGEYTGAAGCRVAKIAAGSVKLCSWGCQGFGDCVAACPFGAIVLGPEGLPLVDPGACTGCGLCAAECPQGILALLPRDRTGAIALCSNRNPDKPAILKGCSIACIRCGLCARSCPEACIEMTEGAPRVDAPRCTSCGVCAEKCPTKAMALRRAGDPPVPVDAV